MDIIAEPQRSVATAMRGFNVGANRLRSTLAAKLNIGMAELRAMTIVAELGTITPKELSVQLDITTGSMTAMIDRLEAASMVARQPHPTDRRSLLLALTPAGQHATAWAQGVLDAALAAVYRANPERDASADATFLAAVAGALNAAAEEQHEL